VVSGDGILRIGTSTYSFWHFLPEKVPIEYVMEKAREMDLDGVEILHVQMESTEDDYLRKLRRLAFLNGLDIYCLAIHNNFVSPDEAKRKEEVDHVKRCLEIAYKLGAPSIRLNSGRWRTIDSFDELMARRGIEPPISGYTDENAYDWIIKAIKDCLPTAEEYGVVMALENHWGLTTQAEGVLKIVNAVNSEWLKVLMDTGNFIYNTYESLEKIAPHTVLVHVKTYFGGGVWYSLDINYQRVFHILKSVNYRGYISIEYEGKEDPLTAVLKTIQLLKKHMD